MSKDSRTLNVLAAVIQRLQQEPSFALKLEELLLTGIKQKIQKEVSKIELDIFEEYAKGGRDGLELKLSKLSEAQLKEIIREHSLDSKKLAQKWKSIERLISLILDKVEGRMNKGSVFLKFGEETSTPE